MPALFLSEDDVREVMDMETSIDVVERATHAEPHEYDRWSETLQRLHNEAADDRLRGMAPAELKMLIED